jgi:hypothetical protein
VAPFLGHPRRGPMGRGGCAERRAALAVARDVRVQLLGRVGLGRAWRGALRQGCPAPAVPRPVPARSAQRL